jgi:flagellar protein FliO/FliZ
MPATLQGAAQGLPGGYGSSLLQALLALGAVCLLAWWVLRALGRHGVGRGGSGRIQVLERVPLDARRTLFLVRVGDRAWLVGAGDGASPTLLAELSPDALPPVPETDDRSFREALGRIAGGGGSR